MDLKISIKEEPVWLEGTGDTSLDSDINNAVDDEHFVKIEPQIPLITPEAENDGLNSRVEDDTAMNLKEETCDGEDNLGETQLYVGDAVSDPEKIFLKEESNDGVHLSDGSTSPGRLLAPVRRKTFQCSVCCKTYTRKCNLKLHSLVHFEDSSMNTLFPTYECVHCNKTYTRRPDYQEHMEMHSGVKKHVCNICNKKFAWRQSLRKHMIVHPDKNPFACKICPKSFKRPGHLRNHLKVHTPEYSQTTLVPSRSYECNICKKAFRRRSNLKVHLGMHNGDAQYECSVCNRMFKWQQCLKLHMMIHTKSKPYPCRECSKAFRRPCDLRRHSMSHTKE